MSSSHATLNTCYHEQIWVTAFLQSGIKTVVIVAGLFSQPDIDEHS